jgi:Ca2+:H+ antiporter
MVIALAGLLFVPVSLALKYLALGSPLIVFIVGALALLAVAEWVRRATGQLASRVGPTIGGLLEVSFGSLAELILALFVLLRGHANVVQAQIAGSILGTSLFGLGLAILVGGATRDRQTFKTERAGLLSSLLILVVIALLLPAVFELTGRSFGEAAQLPVTDEEVSLSVSVVLVILYFANLAFTLVTHRDVFSTDEPRGEAEWSLWVSIAVLVAATAAIAMESELVSRALQQAAKALHLAPMFLGVIVLALIGTGGDIFVGVWFAREDRIGPAIQILIGSAIQTALVVAPLLVLASALFGRPMTLVFSDPLYLFAIAGAAFIVNSVARDGETTWFEGVLLVGVYCLFALAFFFTPAPQT